MRYYHILALLLFMAAESRAQTGLKDITPNKVTVISSGETIRAETQPVKKVKTDTEKFYFWYSGGQINSTQGAFSGKLLNGSYKSYYPNKNLREQGQFKKGLKTGEWFLWADSGRLKQRTNWESGIRSGVFAEYDEQGRVKLSGSYKKGELNGKILAFAGKDSVNTTQYKMGKIVPAKKTTSPSRFRSLAANTKALLLKPFKKKQKPGKKEKKTGPKKSKIKS